MHKRCYFQTDDGSEKLTGDGTYLCESMNMEAESSEIFIAAYDSSDNIVTPSAGTATVEVCPIRGQWHSEASDGDNPIDLSLIGETATYDVPLFDGPFYAARIVLADTDFSTDGISYITAFVWRG